MSTSVKVRAVLVARPGKAVDQRALLGGMVGPSRSEQGNTQYDVWQDTADRDRFIVEERYLDEAATAAHHATPHFAHYLLMINGLAERTAMVLAPLEITGSATTSATPHDTAASGDRYPLGRRIRGVQHFGLTVQNMDRAFAFYTEVLGGTEIMRDGVFHGEAIHDTLMLNDEIEALEQQIDPGTVGVPDLRWGQQRLDVRFIQFDNMVLALLHYREKSQPSGGGAAWAPAHEHRSPAYPRSLHLCFHLRDDVDFNTFVRDLEAESTRRGMTNVRCNRIVSVTTGEGRRNAPLQAMSNKITEGRSNGWALIYARGPEGEALEFVQALSPVKQVFDEASKRRRITNSVPNGAYSVVAEIRAKPGKREELRAATLPLIALVRSDPKNLVYSFQEDRENPGRFIFYEVFATTEDFDAHNNMPYVKQWFARLPELADAA
jgi:quinol monooxygenase YgiN/catechol 2,3-dioxygenase-like lactoylglutathione lyase family enzyme